MVSATSVLLIRGRASCLPSAKNPIRPDEYGARAAWQEGENIVLFALATNGGKAWGLAPRVVVE